MREERLLSGSSREKQSDNNDLARLVALAVTGAKKGGFPQSQQRNVENRPSGVQSLGSKSRYIRLGWIPVLFWYLPLCTYIV